MTTQSAARLEDQIRKIKREIAALGPLRPGALSLQYNVCGNARCQCKATPPVRHGPYHQISFTWKGKSTTQFVRESDVAEAERQIDNYRRLRTLVDEWVTLSIELSRLRARESRRPAMRKSGGKSEIPAKPPGRRSQT